MPLALSISSHVVHGYVGNRAMTFPLQYTGWDVDTLNTTNYSNHPGYGKFKGFKSNPNEVNDIFQGLSQILNIESYYDVIITGYTPTDTVLSTVLSQVQKLFKLGSKSIWVIDPVLGDNGKLYVLETVIPIYQDILKSGHVTLATPNQFEFEVLSGVKINTIDDLKPAVDAFVKLYPEVPYFVITSFSVKLKKNQEAENDFYTLGYRKGEIFYFKLKQIKCNFNGCGDLFTALLTNAFYLNGGDLSIDVLLGVHSKLFKILQNTYEIEKLENKEAFTVVKNLRIVSLRESLLETEKIECNPTYL